MGTAAKEGKVNLSSLATASLSAWPGDPNANQKNKKTSSAWLAMVWGMLGQRTGFQCHKGRPYLCEALEEEVAQVRGFWQLPQAEEAAPLSFSPLTAGQCARDPEEGRGWEGLGCSRG